MTSVSVGGFGAVLFDNYVEHRTKPVSEVRSQAVGFSQLFDSSTAWIDDDHQTIVLAVCECLRTEDKDDLMFNLQLCVKPSRDACKKQCHRDRHFNHLTISIVHASPRH